MQQQKNNLNDNLYRRLSAALSHEDLARLNRIFSRSVMALGPADFEFDIDKLRHVLSLSSPDMVYLDGLKLTVAQLPEQHIQISEAELNEQLTADIPQLI